MNAKYLTTVSENSMIKNQLDQDDVARKVFDEKVASLNTQGDTAHKEYLQTKEEVWNGIKSELHTQGLITDEEKELGTFGINQYNQVFLTGMRPKPVAVADEDGDEAESEAEA